MFDYTNANVNGTAINTSNPVVTIPINSSTSRIISFTVSSLKNIQYTPLYTSSTSSTPLISYIQLTTIASLLTPTKILSRTSLPSSAFTPNDAYDIKNTTAGRVNTKNGDITNISIIYSTVLGGSVGYVLQITLPVGQNIFTSNSGCYVGVGLTPCAVVSVNATDMLITYVPNSTILLTKVQNIFPNTNLLSLHLYLLSPTS